MFGFHIRKYLVLIFMISMVNKIHGRHGKMGLKLSDQDIQKYKVWPKGKIHYYIDEVSFDKVLRDKIRAYLARVSSATSLDFVEMPQPSEDKNMRYVFFINRRGLLDCGDYTTQDFTTEGIQKVILGYNCVNDALLGSLAPTILAIAGIPPQHNAPDRDKYIKVQMENVDPHKQDRFKVLSEDEWPFKDIPYDFASAGHYDLFKYTGKGSATIELKDSKNKDLIGSSIDLTKTDIEKIQWLYSDMTSNKNKEVSSKEKEMCRKMFRPKP